MSQRREFLLKEGKNIKRNGEIFNTFTSRFLLPVVDCTMKDFGPTFLNAHITSGNEPHIYVICEYKEEDASLTTAIIRARINPNFIDTEVVEDEIIFKFKINKDDLPIYKSFIDGKYSKFSKHYKDKLIRIYGNTPIKANRYVSEYDTLFPTDFKRKQIADWTGADIKDIDEVLDSPDLDYEIYLPLSEFKSKELNG